MPILACIDKYEPNDVFQDAKIIPTNTDIYGKISPGFDQDVFKFTTTDAEPKINIGLTDLPADYDVILYNSAIDEIASSLNGDTNNEFIQYDAPVKSGTYYLQVFGVDDANSQKCYTLHVSTKKIIQINKATEVSVDKYRTLAIDVSSLKIYPNPVTNGQLNIQLFSEHSNREQFTVADLTGKIIYSKLLNVYTGINNLNIQLPQLAHGIYIIKTGNKVARINVR